MSQDGMLGEVKIFAGNFPPRGWAFCEGQIMSIEQNNALFSILGTTYGGDGQKTFALPDLRGRSPIGAGQGPGLSSFSDGQVTGAEQVTLTTNQLPAHTHGATATVNASNDVGKEAKPRDNVWSAGDHYDDQVSITMAADTVQVNIQNTGGSQAHENRPPSLAMRWIICINGTYPYRD